MFSTWRLESHFCSVIRLNASMMVFLLKRSTGTGPPQASDTLMGRASGPSIRENPGAVTGDRVPDTKNRKGRVMFQKPRCPVIAVEEHYWDAALAKTYVGLESGRHDPQLERLYDLGE